MYAHAFVPALFVSLSLPLLLISHPLTLSAAGDLLEVYDRLFVAYNDALNLIRDEISGSSVCLTHSHILFFSVCLSLLFSLY